MEREKTQMLYTLAMYGAAAAKLSKKQSMKLKEWILPYLSDELGGAGGPMKIEDMRKMIDAWESADLKEGEYKHYYVDKNSTGKSMWDLI